jgi:hypothetical protein
MQSLSAKWVPNLNNGATPNVLLSFKSVQTDKIGKAFPICTVIKKISAFDGYTLANSMLYQGNARAQDSEFCEMWLKNRAFHGQHDNYQLIKKSLHSGVKKNNGFYMLYDADTTK